MLINNGANSFLPRDIGIDICLDPFNIDGVYGYPADGTGVASFIDTGKSPNNMTQATGGLQPIFKRDIINGNPVLRFSGTEWMSSPNGPNNAYSGAMSLFVVFSTTNNNPAAIARIITKVSSWAPSYQSTNMILSLFGGGTYTGTGLVAANNTFYNTATVFNGSTATNFYRNGTLFLTDTVAGTMAGTSSDVYLGSRDGTQHFISGDVAFIGIFYRALAAWEINTMNFYLNTRFNLS